MLPFKHLRGKVNESKFCKIHSVILIACLVARMLRAQSIIMPTRFMRCAKLVALLIILAWVILNVRNVIKQVTHFISHLDSISSLIIQKQRKSLHGMRSSLPLGARRA